RTHSHVRAHAVNHPVIRVRSLPVDAELASVLRSAGRKHHSGCELNQRLKAPAIHRQVFCKLPVHDGAHGGGLSVDQRSPAFHSESAVLISGVPPSTVTVSEMGPTGSVKPIALAS